MIKLVPNKEYSFRLMPDSLPLKAPIQSIKICIETEKRPYILHKYFSVVLTNDGVLDVLVFSKQINNFIQSVYAGYYGTSEGYYLLSRATTGIDHYYGTSDKSLLNIDESDDHFQYDDVVFFDPCMLHGVKSERILTFKTRMTQGMLDIYNVGTTPAEPLFNGNNHNYITNLYPPNDLIQQTIDDFKEYYTNISAPHVVHFGEAASKYYQESLLINR